MSGVEVDTPVEVPQPGPEPRKDWIARLQALFEVLLLSGLVSSFLAALAISFPARRNATLLSSVPTVAGFLLLEASITFVLLYLVMRVHGETLNWLGLRWQSWVVHVLLGLGIVPVLLILNVVVSNTFRIFFPRYFMLHNPLTEIIHTRQDLALFILTVLVAGGIKEELQRAFILRRFQTYLGGASAGLIIWSAAFGIGHYVQGVQGMVTAGFFGFVLGIAYLARGNLIVPIIGHAAYDTIALLGYWFFGTGS